MKSKKIQKIKEMWDELSGARPADRTAAGSLESRMPPVPPEELVRFLELSLDARTDEYLRRLALFAVQAADIAAVSKRLEQHDRSFTEQSATLATTAKRLDSHLERVERRDRLARVLQPEDLHGQSSAVVQRLQREVAKALDLSVSFRHPLKDGGKGPEMRVIPPGRFMMGSPTSELERDEDEGPQHWVKISKPFAIGGHAVTFADYERFCSKTKRQYPDDGGWGRGWQPVIHVSWQNALDYCVWLSEQTGFAYRLPSEAEWEYAARAGTTTAFWWDDYINTRLANYDGNTSYSGSPTGENRECTLPVKQFDPNPFGLYQVHGNVGEWCQDRWHNSYQDAPVDGMAWEDGRSKNRVVRGGSWISDATYCRSAARGYTPADSRYADVGFRVCCDLIEQP